jgi:hypothetical protein
MTRLSNLPHNIHRQIQALLVRNNNNVPNNRTLALLAVAAGNTIPRTVPHVSGLRNAFAFVKRAADVFNTWFMNSQSMETLTAELDAATARFGLPPLQLRGGGSLADGGYLTMSIGGVEPGGLYELPAVSFASDDSPLAVTFKLTRRPAPSDTRELRAVFMWRSRDLVFKSKHRLYVFSTDRHGAPTSEPRHEVFRTEFKARTLDIPLLRAVQRCAHDMSFSQGRVGLSLKIDRNPAASKEAVRALKGYRQGDSVAVLTSPLPPFLAA